MGVSRLLFALACRLPLYIYETPGSFTSGLQCVNRKLRFKLEKASADGSDVSAENNAADSEDNKAADQSGLINYTGKNFKMEPLATVRDLEKFLLKMVGVLKTPGRDQARFRVANQFGFYSFDSRRAESFSIRW